MIKQNVKEYRTNWQREKRDREATNPEGKIQCQVCSLWYRKVGSHVWQVHGIKARDYRKEYGFDLKRGQLPDEDREKCRKNVFENGTVNNLKLGKKYRYKKGDPTVGRYERSLQTLERLKKGLRK